MGCGQLGNIRGFVILSMALQLISQCDGIAQWMTRVHVAVVLVEGVGTILRVVGCLFLVVKISAEDTAALHRKASVSRLEELEAALRANVAGVAQVVALFVILGVVIVAPLVFGRAVQVVAVMADIKGSSRRVGESAGLELGNASSSGRPCLMTSGVMLGIGRVCRSASTAAVPAATCTSELFEVLAVEPEQESWRGQHENGANGEAEAEVECLGRLIKDKLWLEHVVKIQCSVELERSKK